MANVKATMTDIRVIIRELSRGTSLREMERKLQLSRTSLRNYRDRAEATGRSMADLLSLNDAELQAIMQKGDSHRGRDADRYAFMQENIEGYAKDMMRKHMTYDVLYEEYHRSTDNPYGYTQFKAIIQEYEKNHFYSVPYQHIGKKAKVIYDAEKVEVWIGLDRIAAHDRKHSDGYTTVESHMPEKHIAYKRSKEINAAYLLSKASQVGPHTRESIDCILKSALFVQQAYRSCQGVLRLAGKYGAERLEAACRRIEPKTASTYKRIEAILRNNLDDTPPAQSDMMPYMPKNDNVRGPSAYQ